MSKAFTKDDVIKNKKEAIRSLDRLLEGYINDPTHQHLKKANLISYWIKEYVKYINFEEKFDATKNISYKRGDIIKINFGFNIGAEYGGLHYCIVLDNHNDHNSSVLTVIPLTSIKEGKNIHKNSVDLGSEIYKSIKLKYDTVFKLLKSELEKVSEPLALFEQVIAEARQIIDNATPPDSSTDEKLKSIAEAQAKLEIAEKLRVYHQTKEKELNAQLNNLEAIADEISKMKAGSIALVNQITTISKMRIYDPKNSSGVLYGISLCSESMDKINQKLIDLYVFK